MVCSRPTLQGLALIIGIYLLVVAGGELWRDEVTVTRAMAFQGDPIVGSSTASPLVKILRGCPYSRNFVLSYSRTRYPNEFWWYVGVELSLGLVFLSGGLFAGMIENRLLAGNYDSQMARTAELANQVARERADRGPTPFRSRDS